MLGLCCWDLSLASLAVLRSTRRPPAISLCGWDPTQYRQSTVFSERKYKGFELWGHCRQAIGYRTNRHILGHVWDGRRILRGPSPGDLWGIYIHVAREPLAQPWSPSEGWPIHIRTEYLWHKPFTYNSLALFLVSKSKYKVSKMCSFLNIRLELSRAQLSLPLLA
jgi:hypothetical protein